MNLVDRYINKTEYNDYNDFIETSNLKIPDNFNFGYDIVDEYARLCPNKRALVWCNDKGEEKTLTYGELSRLSNKLANALTANGIKRYDCVMSILNRRYEYWILNVACCKAGIILIPCTFLLCGKDISYRANASGAVAIVCISEDEVIHHVNEAMTECTTVRGLYTLTDIEGYHNLHTEMDAASEDFKRVDTKLNENMLIYFTSGTTGYPKMVTHNFLYPIAHIYTAKYWQVVVDDGLHFTMAETGWAKCSWGKLYGQMIAGTAVFVYDYFGKFTPVDVLPLFAKYNITTFCAPPTIYRFLIKEDMSQFDFSSISHCTTAGEPLNPEVARLFAKLTGLVIHEGFGQTESVVLLGTFENVEPRYGSMGKPCPCYDIVLLDNDENPVPLGVEGELCVRIKRPIQPGLLVQYYNDPARTSSALGGEYYHTGDLAYADKDGYYWFVGRKDDIIKSSGYRIGPFEVESALHEHPAVLECAITAVPDPIRGQIVKATIVLAHGFEPSDVLIKELQNHVKRTTAPYKYPRVIEFVKELPKTTSGKIKRVDIRKSDESK